MNNAHKFASAQTERLSIDTSTMSNWELLSFNNQNVCRLSQKEKDVAANLLPGSKSAEHNDFRTKVCKPLLRTLTIASVKFTSFQELQRRASSRGLKLSAFVYSTKQRELEKEAIKLKQWTMCQTNYSPGLIQVDYRACSNNSLSFAMEDRRADISRNISSAVNYIFSPGGAD